MAIIASSLTAMTSSGRISGSGFARANIRGLLAIEETISLVTMPPFDRPRNTSASTMAEAKSPSEISLANSDLYLFSSPASSLLFVRIPDESTMMIFSFLTPSLT